MRGLLVDHLINVQEVSMYESNKSNMVTTSSQEEIGSLVDLFVTEFDIVSCLLKLGHIVRVWLTIPSQALIFYQQALAFAVKKKTNDESSPVIKTIIDDDEL